MYSSANYVIFINFEDFAEQITQINKEFSKECITFFSGYDCDSLALENITGFLDYILPIFSPYPKSMLEIRTKSARLKPMTIVSPPDNCIIAYSLMPEIMSRVLDHKAPSIERRIKSMTDLANRGWKIGLRFDPLIYGKNWKELYTELIVSISKNIPSEAIHSISFGPLRFPRAMFQKIFKLYPDDILFTGPITQRGSIMAYGEEIENEMALHCRQLFSNFVSDSIIFQCVSEGSSNLSDQV
jgi:spore photoproduct lyase